MATKAYSLWIYDRQCSLIYHHDWSLGNVSSSQQLLVPGADLLPGVSRCTTPVGQGLPSAPHGRSTQKLPLSEQAKLIYGLVFSLRNMLSKLSTSSSADLASQFNTYSTPTYTFAHYQAPSMYTFVILTDPVQPPSRGLLGRPSSEHSSGNHGPVSGGGISGTGGMSLPGVLRQIVAGPWLEWVVKNPAMFAGGLEWEDLEDEPKDDAELDRDDAEGIDGSGVKSKVVRGSRTRGVDSDGLRAGIEAVLAHNKLSTLFTATS
ncbi:unnamed protein product [Parajaminaea phylloscopi]